MIDLMALLELYNTYSHDDIFYEIARNILTRYNDLELDALNNFADSLHVSPSSLNRFLKELFYENFTTFRQEHLKREEYYLFDHARVRPVTCVQSFAQFSHAFLDELSSTLSTIEQEKTDALLRLMEQSGNVIFIGVPIPSEVWWLEMELVLRGKQTSAFLNPNHQVEAIQTCAPGDLVVGLDFVRQDDSFLDQALKVARDRGATTACLTHVLRPGLGERVDLSLTCRGSNTRTDQFALAVLLNYLGNRLREQRTAGGTN